MIRKNDISTPEGYFEDLQLRLSEIPSQPQTVGGVRRITPYLAYAASLVVAVMLAFLRWGLLGCGIAISVAGIIDFFVIMAYCKYKYGYRISANVVRYAAMQLPFGILAYLVTFIQNPWAYWIIGLLAGCASLAVSIAILRRKTTLWESLTQKVLRRIGR